MSSWRNLLFPRAFSTIDAVGGASATPAQGEKRQPRVPSSRLSDAATGDSRSSIDAGLDPASDSGGGSATHFTRIANAAEGTGGIEMHTLSRRAGGAGGGGGSLAIRKTVEVNVISEAHGMARARGTSFLDS